MPVETAHKSAYLALNTYVHVALVTMFSSDKENGLKSTPSPMHCYRHHLHSGFALKL